MQKYSGCGSEPGRAACGSRSDGPPRPGRRTVPAFQSTRAGPGRGDAAHGARGAPSRGSRGHLRRSQAPLPPPAPTAREELRGYEASAGLNPFLPPDNE